MRIAFIGKGGSGKTTLSAQFSHFINAYKKYSLVTIDADVNQHFSALLGSDALRAPALADNFSTVFKILYTQHPFFAASIPIPEFGSFPPTKGVQMLNTDTFDSHFSSIGSKINQNWWHLRVGDYENVEVGGDCYHFKLNALELLLHHTEDSKSDIFIIDSTAGIDTVATSLVMAYDLTVFVVEPTQKSISVANDYIDRVKGENIVCVANKIEDADDIEFIATNLNGELIGTLPFSQTLCKLEQSECQTMKGMLPEFEEACSAILDKLLLQTRDLSTYWSRLCDIFIAESTRYWNGHYGVEYDSIVSDYSRHPFFHASND